MVNHVSDVYSTEVRESIAQIQVILTPYKWIAYFCDITLHSYVRNVNILGSCKNWAGAAVSCNPSIYKIGKDIFKVSWLTRLSGTAKLWVQQEIIPLSLMNKVQSDHGRSLMSTYTHAQREWSRETERHFHMCAYIWNSTYRLAHHK